jgi:sec-independent protein translocase protein TatC
MMLKRRKKTQRPHETSELTVHEHLLELRSRLLLYVAAFTIASVVSYCYNAYIIKVLMLPLHQNLYYNNPIGGFQFTLQVAMFSGFVITVPYFVYQILSYIKPALSVTSKSFIYFFLAGSVVLVCLGVLTAYFLIIPATLHFLSSVSIESIHPLITVDEYFSFITWYLGGFAFLFQLPLVMSLISKHSKIDHKSYLRFQRYVIVLCFFVAAILTPTPDMVNMILFALPLLGLYYCSILFVWIGSVLQNT